MKEPHHACLFNNPEHRRTRRYDRCSSKERSQMTTLTFNTYELDRETALLMGYKYNHQMGRLVINKPGEPSNMMHLWNPTKNINDALSILQRFQMKFYWTGVDWCVYSDDTFGGYIDARHVELPIAICQSLIEHKMKGR